MTLTSRGWYRMAEAVSRLGYDIVIHDPEVEPVDLWDENPEHGVISVRNVNADTWTASTSELSAVDIGTPRIVSKVCSPFDACLTCGGTGRVFSPGRRDGAQCPSCMGEAVNL